MMIPAGTRFSGPLLVLVFCSVLVVLVGRTGMGNRADATLIIDAPSQAGLPRQDSQFRAPRRDVDLEPERRPHASAQPIHPCPHSRKIARAGKRRGTVGLP